MSFPTIWSILPGKWGRKIVGRNIRCTKEPVAVISMPGALPIES